jgi:uncharacterized protein YndB with AHSA1/START domain
LLTGKEEKMEPTSEAERSLTLTRILDAPRDLVFKAWTDPEELRWFLNITPSEPIEVDLRVGGVWKLMMIENEETRYFSGGIYLEIVPVERLVFAWGAVGGWPKLDVEHPERNPIVTITLIEIGEQTEMVFRMDLPDGLTDQEARDWFALGIRGGWSGTIDRLVSKFARG